LLFLCLRTMFSKRFIVLSLLFLFSVLQCCGYCCE